jgi:hypothetical protein
MLQIQDGPARPETARVGDILATQYFLVVTIGGRAHYMLLDFCVKRIISILEACKQLKRENKPRVVLDETPGLRNVATVACCRDPS